VTWLTPIAGLLLAAATIPPLVALYFLKLRRQPRAIASTLLWKRSLEDLRANAPFQRLRMNILLLLQLLALALLALALAQPQVDTGLQRGGKTVILIDNSASMNAIDLSEDLEKPKTRLEFAKEDAIARVEKFFGGGIFSGGSGEVMVIAFADRADVRCNFSESRNQVIDAIRSIAPTDGRTKIGEALQLARAYTSSIDPDKNPLAAIESAMLVIFSDGRIEDIDTQAKKTGETIVFNRVGSNDADNVGVVRVAAERSPDDPDRIQVFASIGNANAIEVRCDVELSVNEAAKSITPDPVVVPPARLIGTTDEPRRKPRRAGETEDAADDEAPGESEGATSATGAADSAALAKAIASGAKVVPGREQVVFLPFAQPRDAVITVSQLRKDDLPIDDAAALVVPPARRLRVAYVGVHSPLLRVLLRGMPLESYDELSAGEFEAAIADGTTEQFDVVVLDKYTPPEGIKLPAGRYLSFSGTPVSDLAPYAEHERVLFRVARQDHPVFRSVNATDLFVAKSQAISPPREAEVLMEGTEGPLMISLDKGGVRVLHVCFDPLLSNWPFSRSWVNFVPNALEWLGSSGDALALAGLQPGSTAAIRIPTAADNVELLHPDGHSEPIVIRDPGQFAYGPLTRVGIYSLSWSEPGQAERLTRRFAVNLLNPLESVIAPVDNLAFADAAVKESGIVGTGNSRSSLWPVLLVVVLLVLLLEWWVYQRRTA
jgi:hypothetical protein